MADTYEDPAFLDHLRRRYPPATVDEAIEQRMSEARRTPYKPPHKDAKAGPLFRGDRTMSHTELDAPHRCDNQCCYNHCRGNPGCYREAQNATQISELQQEHKIERARLSHFADGIAKASAEDFVAQMADGIQHLLLTDLQKEMVKAAMRTLLKGCRVRTMIPFATEGFGS